MVKSKEQKKVEAEKRNKAWNALSLQEQIARIKHAPGASKKQWGRMVKEAHQTLTKTKKINTEGMKAKERRTALKKKSRNSNKGH